MFFHERRVFEINLTSKATYSRVGENRAAKSLQDAPPLPLFDLYKNQTDVQLTGQTCSNFCFVSLKPSDA